MPEANPTSQIILRVLVNYIFLQRFMNGTSRFPPSTLPSPVTLLSPCLPGSRPPVSPPHASFGRNCSASCAQYPWVLSSLIFIFPSLFTRQQYYRPGFFTRPRLLNPLFKMAAMSGDLVSTLETSLQVNLILVQSVWNYANINRTSMS